MIYLFKYCFEDEVVKTVVRKDRISANIANDNGESESVGIQYLKDSLCRLYPGEQINVFKDEKGKPVTDRDDIFVSVTHTKKMVICGISGKPVGIDAEENGRKVQTEKISQRFFTEEEQLKVRLEGESCFFMIWCRKEAFAKWEGHGLSYGIKRIPTVINGEFADEINGVRITGQNITEGYFACAGGEGEVVWTEIPG